MGDIISDCSDELEDVVSWLQDRPRRRTYTLACDVVLWRKLGVLARMGAGPAPGGRCGRPVADAWTPCMAAMERDWVLPWTSLRRDELEGSPGGRRERWSGACITRNARRDRGNHWRPSTHASAHKFGAPTAPAPDAAATVHAGILLVTATTTTSAARDDDDGHHGGPCADRRGQGALRRGQGRGPQGPRKETRGRQEARKCAHHCCHSSLAE